MTESAPDGGPFRIRIAPRAVTVLPPDTVRVGYGTKWANPWEHHALVPWKNGRGGSVKLVERAHQMAAGWHRDELLTKGRIVLPETRFKAETVVTVEDIKRELRGKNVACRCQLFHACHGDTLMEVANGWPVPSLLLGPQKQPPSPAIQEAIEQMEQASRGRR